MSEDAMDCVLRQYDVKGCSAADLSETEIAVCIALITEGGAVDPDWAAVELPRTQLLAVARLENEIVGIGAIKRVRLDYAADKAVRSGSTFDPNMPELGYVAVEEKHRRQHLATRIVDELLKDRSGPVYATTDSAGMKITLAQAGFVQRGHEWAGQRGQLSLWIKEG